MDKQANIGGLLTKLLSPRMAPRMLKNRPLIRNAGNFAMTHIAERAGQPTAGVAKATRKALFNSARNHRNDLADTRKLKLLGTGAAVGLPTAGFGALKGFDYAAQTLGPKIDSAVVDGVDSVARLFKGSSDLHPMAQAFFARCEQAGMSREQIKHAVDVLATKFDDSLIEPLRDGLEKQANPLAAGIGKGLGAAGSWLAGKATPWMARGAIRGAQGVSRATSAMSKAGPLGQWATQTGMGALGGAATGLGTGIDPLAGAVAGAGLMNPMTRRMMGSRFNPYIGQPATRALTGAVGGGVLDQGLGELGIDTGNAFGRMGAFGGAASRLGSLAARPGVSGMASRLGGAARGMDRAINRFGKGTYEIFNKGINTMTRPVGRLVGRTVPSLSTPALGTTAGKWGGRAGLTAAGAAVGVPLASGVFNNVIEGKASEMLQAVMDNPDAIRPVVDNYLQSQFGMTGDQLAQHLKASTNPMGIIGSIADGLLGSLGMDPNQMSGMQKAMILLGGLGLLGGGLTGSGTAMGMGGMGLAMGLLPYLMGGGQQDPSMLSQAQQQAVPQGGPDELARQQAQDAQAAEMAMG